MKENVTLMSTIGQTAITIGNFISADKFLQKLSTKFVWLEQTLGNSLFYFKRTGALPVGAANDVIVSRSVSSLLRTNPTFRGFCKISERNFLSRLSERTVSFDSDVKRTFKKRGIQLMLKDSPFNVKKSTYRKAFKLVEKHLLIEQAKLEPFSFQDAAQRLKLQAGAGFWFFTKKANVLLDILNSASYIYSLSTDELANIILFPSYVAYRVQQRSSGVKLRLIYVYPAVITLFEQVFLSPVLDFFISNNKKIPYCISNVGQDLVIRYSNWQTRDRVISIDWSSFDQLANKYLIKDSFSIIRKMFPNLSRSESFLFDLIVWYFLFTPILTTEPKTNVDKIVLKKRGVPSGSSFTNLIDTIVNLLATYSYFIEMGFDIEKDMVATLGDDIVIATNHLFSLKHFKDTMSNWFDMEVNLEKSKIFKNGEKVYFLGALINGSGRYIDPELALYQVSTTTSDLFRKCNNSLEHYQRVKDKLASVLFKYSDGYLIYDKLIVEVRKYLDIPYDTGDFYTEVGTRATAPGLLIDTGETKNVSFMKVHGWLIQ